MQDPKTPAAHNSAAGVLGPYTTLQPVAARSGITANTC